MFPILTWTMGRAPAIAVLAVLTACVPHRPAGFLAGDDTLARTPAPLVLIWSHGSRDEYQTDTCPGVPPGIADLDGRRAGSRIVRIYRTCDAALSSTVQFVTGSGERKVDRRARALTQTVDRVIAAGVPREAIVLAGQSCGAWAGLLMAASQPERPLRQLAFAPACHGPLAQNRASAASGHPVGRGIMRDRAEDIAGISGLAHLEALVFTAADDPFAPDADLAFLRAIPGVRHVHDPAPLGHLAVWDAAYTAARQDLIRGFLAVTPPRPAAHRGDAESPQAARPRPRTAP